MSDREDAIKKLLDDGDELTEENIKAAMPPKPDTNKEVIQSLNAISQKLNEVIDAVNSQNNREIKIPEIKIPEIKIPEQRVIQVPMERKPRKLNFSFVRDENGNIISATATEE